MDEVVETVLKKREEVFDKVDGNISAAQQVQKVKPFYTNLI